MYSMEDQNYQQIAKTYQGLEPVLAEELKNLGAENIQVLKRAVSYEGDNALLYKANLYLRSAIAVLVPVDHFLADSPDELYEKACRIPWEQFFNWNDTFVINHSINSTHFSHSQFAALKLKDAIVDYFKNKAGKRPSVDREFPKMRINLHIHNKDVTISFDSSGEPLFKRGYRQRHSPAILNEVLAAGMILLTGWKGEKTFIDPMCGSGTLPIEAAMIALNIPPGYHRHEYGFMHWGDYDDSIWRDIREEARHNMLKSIDYQIIGSDLLAENIEKAKKNAHILRCNQLKFAVRDFFDFDLTGLKPALVMINPPYGERLESETDLGEFYQSVGNELKSRFDDCEAWIISSNMEALKMLGLHASAKYQLYNGPLACKYQRFELYEGSRKSAKIA